MADLMKMFREYMAQVPKAGPSEQLMGPVTGMPAAALRHLMPALKNRNVQDMLDATGPGGGGIDDIITKGVAPMMGMAASPKVNSWIMDNLMTEIPEMAKKYSKTWRKGARVDLEDIAGEAQARAIEIMNDPKWVGSKDDLMKDLQAAIMRGVRRMTGAAGESLDYMDDAGRTVADTVAAPEVIAQAAPEIRREAKGIEMFRDIYAPSQSALDIYMNMAGKGHRTIAEASGLGTKQVRNLKPNLKNLYEAVMSEPVDRASAIERLKAQRKLIPRVKNDRGNLVPAITKDHVPTLGFEGKEAKVLQEWLRGDKIDHIERQGIDPVTLSDMIEHMFKKFSEGK